MVNVCGCVGPRRPDQAVGHVELERRIREADVLGDLYDLVSGSVKGRRSDSDITFFKNAGGGHLDLITAEVIFRQLADRERLRE